MHQGKVVPSFIKIILQVAVPIQKIKIIMLIEFNIQLFMLFIVNNRYQFKQSRMCIALILNKNSLVRKAQAITQKGAYYYANSILMDNFH